MDKLVMHQIIELKRDWMTYWMKSFMYIVTISISYRLPDIKCYSGIHNSHLYNIYYKEKCRPCLKTYWPGFFGHEKLLSLHLWSTMENHINGMVYKRLSFCAVVYI